MLPTIRSMTQKDIDRVYEIELTAHRAPWSRQILSDCVLVGYDCRVLELEDDGVKSIEGYLISRYQLDVCHILTICIAPLQQGKKYGELLLKTLLAFANKPEINTVILEVRPSNLAALRLYEKLGFQKRASVYFAIFKTL